MKIHPLRLTTLALFCGPFLAAEAAPAQPVDDTQPKQVIIFGRHGVRSPVVPYSTLKAFSVLTYPMFNVAPGNQTIPSSLTINGGTNETILGGYFRLWLTQEGLLTGNDSADANFIYFRALDTPLITDTAKAFWTGMLPAAGPPNVNVVSPGSDPLFDPIRCGRGAAQLSDGGRGRGTSGQ